MFHSLLGDLIYPVKAEASHRSCAFVFVDDEPGAPGPYVVRCVFKAQTDLMFNTYSEVCVEEFSRIVLLTFSIAYLPFSIVKHLTFFTTFLFFFFF